MDQKTANLKQLLERRNQTAASKARYERRLLEVKGDRITTQAVQNGVDAQRRIVQMIDAKIACLLSGKQFRIARRRGGLTF